MRVQIQENVIRYIGNCRTAHDPSRKRKLNGGGDQVSYILQRNLNSNRGTDTTVRTHKYRLTGAALDVVLVTAATLKGGKQDGNNSGVGCE